MKAANTEQAIVVCIHALPASLDVENLTPLVMEPLDIGSASFQQEMELDDTVAVDMVHNKEVAGNDVSDDPGVNLVADNVKSVVTKAEEVNLQLLDTGKYHSIVSTESCS